MPGPPSRLIAAAVRPFSENAELKQSAIGFLENRVTEAADPDAMITRWDEVDARKRKSVWPGALWLLVAVVSAGIATTNFHEFSRLAQWGKSLSVGFGFFPRPSGSETITFHQLSESENLLLFGDRSKQTKAERKKALWQSEPDNPAYFADYAGAFIGDQEKLPPDFLKTALRIDPTNSWFTYLAAAVEAKNSVKKKARKSKRVAGKFVYEEPQSWEILDQARLDRAMDLLKEARSQPKYTSYSAELLRKRLPLLPQETFIEQIDSGTCLNEISVFSSISLRRLGDAIAAKAWSIGQAGNAAAYQEVSSDGDQFLRQMHRDENGSLLDEMVSQVIAFTLAENLATAAERLNLENEFARWNPVAKSLQHTRDQRQSREFIVDGKAVEKGKVAGFILIGGIGMVAKQSETQPPLTDADIKPMRLFDHELLSRFFSYISWIVVALCAGFAACYRFRVAAMSRRLASRMQELLRLSDWGWILVAGVALPFVFVMGINRLTPLGGRALGVQGMGLLLPAGHFFGLLLLWLTLPVQIIRWRLAQRAGAFGFSGPSLTGWLTVVSAAAFVPVVGWAAISESDFYLPAIHQFSRWPWQAWTAAGLGGIAILGVIVSIGIAMLGRAERHLYRATSALALVKVFAVAMLVIALASVGFKASERYWFKQDWMTKFDIAGPGWSAFESQVAAQLRKELRETLGYDP